MAIILKPTQEDIDNKFRSSYYKAKTAKKCVYCGSIFYYGKSSHMSCGLCSIKYNCKECNKEVVIQISKMSGQRQALIKDIIEKGTLNLYEAFCNQSCSNKNRTRPGICTSCGKFSNKRISSGMCLTCQKAVSKKTMEKYKKAGNCGSPDLGQKITKGFHIKPATFSNKSTIQYGDADRAKDGCFFDQKRRERKSS